MPPKHSGRLHQRHRRPPRIRPPRQQRNRQPLRAREHYSLAQQPALRSRQLLSEKLVLNDKRCARTELPHYQPHESTEHRGRVSRGGGPWSRIRGPFQKVARTAPTQTYFFADRSNFGVDMFNSDDNTFIGRLGGFVGPSTSTDTAGPNGLLEIHSLHQLWAGDGDSTVKVFDLRSDSPRRIAVISTGGQRRADEMAFDERDHVLLVANDADDTPFVTFISTETRQVLGRIFFDGVQAHNATNGLEQPVWDPDTQQFFLSVPEINGNPATGEIAVIDPRSMSVTNTYPVNRCQPAGLAEGGFGNLLVGCANHDDVTFPPNLIVLDARTGSLLANIPQVGGADEVWFNEGDGRFYVAARDNPGGAVLGVIDAVTNTWIENVRTAFNAHSVAADRKNNHVLVPLRPPRIGHADPDPCVAFGGPSFTGRGCIGVYAND